MMDNGLTAKSNKILFAIRIIIKWYLNRVYSCFLKQSDKPIHLLFCTCDHYEPGTRNVPKDVEIKRIDDLLRGYPQLADRHKDFHGNIPKRTWFFPPHYHRNYSLKKLVSLCEMGYGEIELHLHHGKTRPDNAANLYNTILQCIEEYSHYGIFGSLNENKKYGFIHGDWALDNSMNGKYCGVNNEITILCQTGCYADFTFPSSTISNPRQINSIYYAIDNPEKAKSYDTGPLVRSHSCQRGHLMIVQGPLHPFFFSNNIASLRTPGDAINGNPAVTEKRVDYWVKTGIHIAGKRNWIIIKTHTHGATDSTAVLGDEMNNIYNYLENRYSDGENYVLHYVTARELYNIIKSIEAGENGTNPELYRNYLIDKPKYDSSPDIPELSNTLKSLICQTY